MNTALVGFNTKDVTFYTTASFSTGHPVIVNDENSISKAEADTPFCGFVSAVNGNYASVTMSGYVKVRYTGTNPSVGYNLLSSNGTTGVKIDTENGRQILVVGVDTQNRTAEILL